MDHPPAVVLSQWDHWIPTVRPAVDAIARTRAAAKEAGSDDYSSLLYFFPFVCTPLVSLPFGAPNYDHQPAGPALSDNVCSNISSCKSAGSFVKRDSTSGKWKAQYRTSSGHSVLLGLYDTKEDALQKVQSVQGNSSSGLASAMNNSSSGVTPAQPPPVPPPLKVTANAIPYSQTVAHVGGGGSGGQKRSYSAAMGKSGGKAAPIFKMPQTKKATGWKPFNCPERSCSKLYTHQRKCANHPDLMCITYAELRQRYMAEAMKESSSSSEESDDEEDEEEDDEEIGGKATGSSEGNKKAAAAVVAETGIGEISSNGPSSSSSTQSMEPAEPALSDNVAAPGEPSTAAAPESMDVA